MSSWGNLDNVLITGNVSSATTRDYIDGYETEFTSNVNAGDYIVFAGNKYQVQNVESDVKLYLTNVAATNSANVDAFVQQGPKYIANVSFPANNYSIQNIYGVDRNEIDVPENQDRGINHTGWVHYTTYTDAYSQVRNKAETIVAMSKNFDSNATGELFAVPASFDASDDTVLADYLIYFTSQPEDVTDYLANLSSATFQVVADSDPAGASITYQWYENNTTHIYSIAEAGVYSDVTTNTLAISNVSGLDGYSYFVIISGDGGADSNTSGNATITII